MIQLGNVTLDRPITIASGPLTDSFTKIKAAQDAGSGAVSLKLTFVEVPFQSQMRSYSIPGKVIMSPTNKRLDMAKAFDLMKRCKDELTVPMLANYSALGNALGDWELMTKRLLDAGADMLEPNFCCPNLDTSAPTDTEHSDHGGASIGENPTVAAKLVSLMREMTDRPIIPKIVASDRHLMQQAAVAMQDAGADALHYVGTPISGLPPVNDDGTPMIPLIDGVPQGSTNGSICKYSTFLGIAHLAQVLDIPIMASGGLDDWKDCIDAIAWGATAPSVCSAIMWNGWDVVGQMNDPRWRTEDRECRLFKPGFFDRETGRPRFEFGRRRRHMSFDHETMAAGDGATGEDGQDVTFGPRPAGCTFLPFDALAFRQLDSIQGKIRWHAQAMLEHVARRCVQPGIEHDTSSAT